MKKPKQMYYITLNFEQTFKKYIKSFTSPFLSIINVINFELYNFLLNIISIKKYGSIMDEDLKPTVKLRGSSPHFCNL
jgi:hypothetical protein